ncbi:hypothetical protein DFR76_104584 [Nocardia pseudobrasiliensis]|uniref:Uncharacterized protein n=1 Tax=Nocardia pseudobrasiliensis TaxID=45979 RepID=A0A370I9P5_9NOCA|nr:hypothetical protein DFR76_104584 [Nocardia pseudobrasiliensis]
MPTYAHAACAQAILGRCRCADRQEMATSPDIDVTFAGYDLVLRLASAGYLARYTGTSREHCGSDLRLYFLWCTERHLTPLAMSRARDRTLRRLDARVLPHLCDRRRARPLAAGYIPKDLTERALADTVKAVLIPASRPGENARYIWAISDGSSGSVPIKQRRSWRGGRRRRGISPHARSQRNCLPTPSTTPAACTDRDCRPLAAYPSATADAPRTNLTGKCGSRSPVGPKPVQFRWTQS